MAEHYQYDKDELAVGMEVATLHASPYIWSSHKLWKIRKITALTPKKTKATFEDGNVRDFKKVHGKYFTGVYKPDEEMERVNDATYAFLESKKYIGFLRDNVESMDDEVLLRIAGMLKEAAEIAGVNDGT